MKDKPRTQDERSAATQVALIAAARPLFAEHGFAGVSTEVIVRAAGVTRGAMYHHFADKTELFAAVFEAVEAQVTQRIDDAVNSAGAMDPMQLMRFGAQAWLDACVDPAVQRIILLEAPAVLGWKRWREIGLRYGMGLVRGMLEYALAEGALPPQPVDPLAHVLIGALDEASIYMATSPDPEQARKDVGRVIDSLIVALDPRDQQRSVDGEHQPPDQPGRSA